MIIAVEGLVGDLHESVSTLLSTPAGTVPFDRNYGIDMDGLDRPPEVAEALLRAELEEKITRYQPTIRIDDVIFNADVTGQLCIRVVLSYAAE